MTFGTPVSPETTRSSPRFGSGSSPATTSSPAAILRRARSSVGVIDIAKRIARARSGCASVWFTGRSLRECSGWWRQCLACANAGMHGIIFVELQKYVTARLGESTWAVLLADAGLRNQHYFPSSEYPDTQAMA